MWEDDRDFLKKMYDKGYVPDETFYRKIFANSLRFIRNEKRLSRKEVANGIGVPEDFIVECESANISPELLILVKLARFFDVSIDALIGHKAENNSNVWRYRVNRAMELVQASGNEVAFIDDGGVLLIVFDNKVKRDIYDPENYVIELDNGEAFAEYIDTILERIFHDGSTFDNAVRRAMDEWNNRPKQRLH